MRYIIFDLEATCWEEQEKGNKEGEIIEIGAVKLDDKLEIADVFSEFVKPTVNPTLSVFCKGLTTIRQEDVDGALEFNEAIKKFEDWILSEDGDARLLSWGYYDKKQILKESAAKNYSGEIIKLLEEKHISLKHKFAKSRKIKTCGMKRALEILNLPLEGEHHRGIDDAKNIARIFRTVYPDLIKYI
jgi:3'-5' exoribonuclease 1